MSCKQGSKAAITMPMGTPKWPQCGKWPWYCTCTIQDGSHELDMESVKLFLSADVLTVPRALITPMVRLCRPHGQMSLTLRIYKLRWFQWIWQSESAQWLLCSSVGNVPGSFITPVGTSMLLWMGKWPCRCTSTCQDGSIELEGIGPVFAELRRPQSSKTTYNSRGYAHVSPTG